MRKKNGGSKKPLDLFLYYAKTIYLNLKPERKFKVLVADIEEEAIE